MVATAALSQWVMLEPFAFKPLRGDPRTTATGTTSRDIRFQVSFVVAEPPTPSRMYISWPEGPDCASMFCHLVAAHRDLILLRLDLTEPSGEYWYEYFIYIARSTSQDHRPLLQRLPPCVAYDDDRAMTMMTWFTTVEVGVLCHGEDEFAVVGLRSARWFPKESQVKANLWVFRSSRSNRGDAAAGHWEKKQLLIQYHEEPWRTYAVVPFNNSLCWVNYAEGILVCDWDDILADRPRVSYIRFPVNSCTGDHRLMQYCRLCVTDGGSRLSLVEVARQDDTTTGPMAPGTGFTLTVRTLADMATKNGTMFWQPNAEAVITSDQLWAANDASLPHDLMLFPLLSMDVANIVHAFLFNWDTGKISVVAINLIGGKVLGSFDPHIMLLEDRNISADDNELAEAKNSFFGAFLSSEFPRFLNLSRSTEGELPTSDILDSRKRKAQA